METFARLVRSRFPAFFYWLYRLKSRQYQHQTTQDIFTQKYQQNLWRGLESRSGPGSSLENTRGVRQKLPGLLHSIGAKTLLDIPCGDFHWMSQVDLPVELYIGADIVEPLVEQNRQQYAQANREFRTLDLITDPLPRVDLILCRDCLVHFSTRDILRALGQIRQSGSTYLLTTTYPQKLKNVDILTGQFRPVNLEAEPFHFPPPRALLLEETTEQGGFLADKSLGLWLISDLQLAGGEPPGGEIHEKRTN